MTFTHLEKQQFSRQTILPGFGFVAQEKLKQAKVLVVGCGGLGSPVLLYLAAAGVGTIGIAEFDTVDISNLHRQILFDHQHVGLAKVEVALAKLKNMYPQIVLHSHFDGLTVQNALEIIETYDLVVDASDNFPTRYLINDACEIKNKPFVYAAIHQFEGQVAVFNFEGSCTYRDLYPSPPDAAMAPNCATAGVVGALGGVIGSLQASEAIKILTGIGKPLINQVLLIEVLNMQFRNIKVPLVSNRKKIEKLIDYEAFCGNFPAYELSIKTYISYFIDQNRPHILIDIRPEEEYQAENIETTRVDPEDLKDNPEQLLPSNTYILHCASGQRSRVLVRFLREQKGLQNVWAFVGTMKQLQKVELR
jgi:sulfur-carrier protein adenylyltransferase/sulfurtransferase